MFRVASIVLGMVGLAAMFFGFSLCQGTPSVCDPSRVTGWITPPQVQALLIVVGFLGLIGGIVGWKRGPTTVPVSSAPESGASMDDGAVAAPYRWIPLLASLALIAGVLVPVLSAMGTAPGLGVPYAVTVAVSLLLGAYFGWSLQSRNRS